MFASRWGPAFLLLGLPCAAEDRLPAVPISRAWYILSQTDARGTSLLHGLPERMSHAVLSPAGKADRKNTVQPNGRLTVDVEIDGTENGEVLLGFFADPRWWIADPIDVRRVNGRGKHLLEGLHPGNYVIGAMLGALPNVRALGVHQTWPAAVRVSASESSPVRIRVSANFKSNPNNLPSIPPDRERGPRVRGRLAAVHVVDENKQPLPFARITFVDRDKKQTRYFHDRVTDLRGIVTCDRIPDTFSLMAIRFDSVPATLTSRWYHHRFGDLHSVSDGSTFDLTVGPIPVGTGRLYGRVHDQNGKPLKEYFISLTRQIGGDALADHAERAEHGINVPVTAPDGRYEIRDLPAGTYRVMVRHFDYQTHVWSFNGPEVTIPEGKNAAARLDVEVEAKELWYGKALCSDGITPVPEGSYSLRLRNLPRHGGGGMRIAVSDRLNPDGTFRIALSKEDRQQSMETAAGIVEIQCLANHQKDEVFFGELSKDLNHPAVFVTEIKAPAKSK